MGGTRARTDRGDQASFTGELSLELERLALRAIRASYDDINLTFFRGKLRRPVFSLAPPGTRLGWFNAEERTLFLSRELLLRHDWGVLVEVLKHEIAHQYVFEVLGAADESAHGPSFRRVCAERGFDARAVGIPAPDVSGAPDSGEAALLHKVRHLLALAESANEHEAQAAMNTAQRLMLKYNLSSVESGVRAEYRYRHLGVATGRINEAERILAGVLGSYFFVDTIWVPVWRPLLGKRGSILEICGKPANVDLAEYVHGFLLHTSERLWREHQRALGIRRNADRQAFLAGVMTGFRDKLEAEQSQQRAAGLIWVGDPVLANFMRSRHPYTRSSRYVSSERQSAHQTGRAAGSRIVLHRGVSAGPSGGRKLLGRGR